MQVPYDFEEELARGSPQEGQSSTSGPYDFLGEIPQKTNVGITKDASDDMSTVVENGNMQPIAGLELHTERALKDSSRGSGSDDTALCSLGDPKTTASQPSEGLALETAVPEPSESDATMVSVGVAESTEGHQICATGDVHDEEILRAPKAADVVGSEMEAGPTELAISNLAWWTTDQELEDLLAPFGQLRDLQIAFEPVNGKSRGAARAHFALPSAARRAVEQISTVELGGRNLSVSFAVDLGEGSSASVAAARSEAPGARGARRDGGQATLFQSEKRGGAKRDRVRGGRQRHQGSAAQLAYPAGFLMNPTAPGLHGGAFPPPGSFAHFPVAGAGWGLHFPPPFAPGSVIPRMPQRGAFPVPSAPVSGGFRLGYSGARHGGNSGFNQSDAVESSQRGFSSVAVSSETSTRNEHRPSPGASSAFAEESARQRPRDLENNRPRKRERVDAQRDDATHSRSHDRMDSTRQHTRDSSLDREGRTREEHRDESSRQRRRHDSKTSRDSRFARSERDGRAERSSRPSRNEEHTRAEHRGRRGSRERASAEKGSSTRGADAPGDDRGRPGLREERWPMGDERHDRGSRRSRHETLSQRDRETRSEKIDGGSARDQPDRATMVVTIVNPPKESTALAERRVRHAREQKRDAPTIEQSIATAWHRGSHRRLVTSSAQRDES